MCVCMCMNVKLTGRNLKNNSNKSIYFRIKKNYKQIIKLNFVQYQKLGNLLKVSKLAAAIVYYNKKNLKIKIKIDFENRGSQFCYIYIFFIGIFSLFITNN